MPNPPEPPNTVCVQCYWYWRNKATQEDVCISKAARIAGYDVVTGKPLPKQRTVYLCRDINTGDCAFYDAKDGG